MPSYAQSATITNFYTHSEDDDISAGFCLADTKQAQNEAMLVHVAFILCANHVWQVDSSDIPKSHIELLDELCSKYLNITSAPQNSIVDLLFGDINATTEDSIQNLDVNILNHNTLKEIIKAEKDKYNNSIHEYRRQYEYPDLALGDTRKRLLIQKIFYMMKQSIYSARYRLAETKLLRIKFREDIPYNLGIIVANVYQLLLKCEHLYNQMANFLVYTFFLWHLIIYEKILACHTDVEYLVQRAFTYQEKFHENLANQEELINPHPGPGSNNGNEEFPQEMHSTPYPAYGSPKAGAPALISHASHKPGGDEGSQIG